MQVTKDNLATPARLDNINCIIIQIQLQLFF